MRERLLEFDGNTMRVREVDFEVASEQWSQYKLLDGGIVRLKTSPLKIFRVLDAQGNPAFHPDGEPNIVVNHATQVVCSEGS